ncbi:SigE family RNA polymerase sigma factor [Nocardioides islandensis]|jgi:RNA polymerase sigma-70 factor (ECF subfamily)|uniref:SigE family RNA polymerase sigma factor n=1 Tax=Nocardioides islandensis TaxID=433663 RepID=A0A930YDJ6_9ACTN|nr:SigE family RNA polymerase sigma factor [Nocardioides islandensis]MBF4762838.1 SigE family RNA polymerase sigma factor [Nocardioides islandensis]
MAEGEVLARGPVATGVDVAAVFAASYRRLVVQLYGVTGNAGEAEDLVQEAFVRAYAAGARFRRVDNPEAWLRVTAINLHRTRWRKMRNFARIKDRITGPPDLPGLEEHWEVVDALRRLPENLRVVLVLHYLADRQVHQIAEELGVAEGTVKSRLSRGRDALAAELGQEERS